MGGYKFRKTTEAVLIILFIGALILFPAIVRLEVRNAVIEPETEQERIRNRFAKLRSMDSTSYWDIDRSWIHEYSLEKQASIEDHIGRTNKLFEDSIINRNYRWFDQFTRQELTIGFSMSQQDLKSSVSARESIRDFGKYLTRVHDYLINDFLVYSELYNSDKSLLKDFSLQFLKIPFVTSDTRTETAYRVITFIQSLEYINMKEYRLLGDSLIYCGPDRKGRVEECVPPFKLPVFYERSALAEGKPVPRFIKHEVFTPSETLLYGKGDCDTRTLLAYTILKDLGFDVATMRIHYYDNGKSSWHGMLGIADVRNNGPYYFVYKGRKYYYVELTRPNWWIGEITPDQKMYGRLIGLDLPMPAIRYGSLCENG